MITGVVIALLLLGVLLILLEILFVPGTTVVGVGGVILLGIGIFLSYQYLGTIAGHVSLASCLVVIFLSLIVLLKGQTWKRMALETTIDGKSVGQVENMVSVGDVGVSISRLNPMGKAMFGDRILEVTTTGEFIEADKEIEVIKVQQNRVTVKST